MHLITLDFETYWSTSHSLSSMNPIAYVMHPDTEVQSVSICIGDDDPVFIIGEERIRAALEEVDFSDALVVAHNNSEFDAMLAAWRFNVRPKMWGCTLAMARPHTRLLNGSLSLGAVAKALGIEEEKLSLEDVNTKGKKVKDFTRDERRRLRAYNNRDTILCRNIFKHLAPLTSKKEMQIIDMTIRMLVEPVFELDKKLLLDALKEERLRKRQAIMAVAAAAGIHTDNAEEAMRDTLMSQQKFAGLLVSLGAEVPMKESKTTPGKMIPALAKTDEGLLKLIEHEDPRVQVAAGARLGIKSTQLETRIESFIRVAEVCGGRMPMPYRYYGAEATGRLSGTMKLNMQNMPRVDEKEPKPADVLRLSLLAPEDCVVVVVDSSNIELRVTHAISGQDDTVEMLRNKQDLYCDFASTLFGRLITKADFMERFIGKTAHLGLQYGASWEAFQRMVRILSTQIGKPMNMTEAECRNVVSLWRSRHSMISDRTVGMWGRCDRAIEAMYNGVTIDVDKRGLCKTAHEAIILPSGRMLYYPDLRREKRADGKWEWKYGRGRSERRIYSSMLLENISQAASRDIVFEQTLEIAKLVKVVSSTHDECGSIVKEELAEETLARNIKIFSTPPKYWPDLPLAAEGGYAKRYGDAK